MTGQDITASDLADGREIAINWRRVLENIVDDYEKYEGIVHGVQKDAVQNGWDARMHSDGKGWAFRFELHQGSDGAFSTYVSMTDSGTHGLTGHVLSREEMEGELPPVERWGRFQSLAFTKEEEEGTIGARGQGKFIFIGASGTKTIYYDSLREDGSYRVGAHAVVGKTSCRVKHWDEDEGRELLTSRFPSLSPLSEVGTRVIIVDPIDDLVKAINDGSLCNMISDTWWEIIQKYGAQITVQGEGEVQTAEVPRYLEELPHTDTDEVKAWYRENDSVEISGEDHRIKRLHLVWKDAEQVPSHTRGIGIQRSGMKVCTEDPPRDLSKNTADGIYGYIQFDDGLDELMAAAEGVTHYDFDWRRRGAAQVRRYLRDQVIEFAYEKLGFGIAPQARRNRLHRKAEQRALSAANQLAEALDIAATGLGTRKNGKGKNGPTPPRPQEPIRLEMPQLVLPREGLRIEYGDTVEGISATAFNESEQDLSVRLKMWMFTADTGNVVYEFLPAVDFELRRDSKKGPFGPFAITLNEEDFYPGRYRIRARLVCMDYYEPDYKKGDELGVATKTFYLASDPPERLSGMWEGIEAVELPAQQLGHHVPGEHRGYVYKYNVKHRAFEAIGEDQDALGEYLFRLLSQAVFEIDLQSDTPALFDGEAREQPDQLAQEMRRLRGAWLHDYYA